MCGRQSGEFSSKSGKDQLRGLSSDTTSNFLNKLYKKCMTGSKENFYRDIRNKRVTSIPNDTSDTRGKNSHEVFRFIFMIWRIKYIHVYNTGFNWSLAWSFLISSPLLTFAYTTRHVLLWFSHDAKYSFLKLRNVTFKRLACISDSDLSRL